MRANLPFLGLAILAVLVPGTSPASGGTPPGRGARPDPSPAAPLAAQPAGRSETGLRIVAQRSLTADERPASDVRWASADSVFLGAGPRGVIKVPIAAPGKITTALPGGRKEGIWLAAKVAVSAGYVVTGAPAWSLAWVKRSADPDSFRESPFATIVDLDVFGDRLAVLGARRDEAGHYTPEGAILWVGSLSHRLSDITPRLFSEPSPQAAPGDPPARAMVYCASLNLGAVRFLADGSLLVVPGVQPGVLLYDPQGKLVRTWPTQELGFQDRCDLDSEQSQSFGRHPLAFLSWVNQRRVLSDILPLPEGPALVVRESHGEETRWELLVLRPNAPARRLPLPFTAPSPYAHLRGDVRGDRAVFLVVDSRFAQRPPAFPARLIVTTLPSQP